MVSVVSVSLPSCLIITDQDIGRMEKSFEQTLDILQTFGSVLDNGMTFMMKSRVD
jgi:hypothetical protein